MNRVAVVIPNWNGAKSLAQSVESILRQKSVPLKVIVVDNGSTDDSLEVLKKIQKSANKDALEILVQKKNLGFAAGVNVGIKHALAENYFAIALFNNDAVAKDTWLQTLLAALSRDNDIGIVTGSLLDQNGKIIDSTGEYMSSWGLPFPYLRGQPVSKIPSAKDVFGATGGASLYRSEMLRKVGLFDETFFAYYEDVDISYRARLFGWRITYRPDAIAYHEQGMTSKKIPGFTVYQSFKNLPLLYIKNTPHQLLISVGARLWLAYILMFGKAIINGNGLFALKGAIFSIWLFFTHGIPERLKIQKAMTVLPSDIKQLFWNGVPPNQTNLRTFVHFFSIRKSQ